MTAPWRPGDLALHRNNQLDARPVEEVERRDGLTLISLRIGTVVTPLLPARRYRRVGRQGCGAEA